MPEAGRPDWRMLLILATAAVIVFLGHALDHSSGEGTEPTVPPSGAEMPRDMPG